MYYIYICIIYIYMQYMQSWQVLKGNSNGLLPYNISIILI